MVPVQGIDRHHHRVAGADFAPAQRVCDLGRARQEGRGRIEAQRLVDDAHGQGQRAQVGGGGGAGTQGGAGLIGGGLLHGGGEGHQIQRPGQGQGGRLVARHDEGQQIVAQLVPGHGAAGLGVLGHQQQVQQVGRAVLGGGGGAARDGLIGDALHLFQPRPREQPPRTRQPGGQTQHIHQRQLCRLRDIGVDRAMHRVAVEHPVARKGHVRDHLEGRGHGLLEQVDRAARL